MMNQHDTPGASTSSAASARPTDRRAALITGAGSGIGREVAVRLAAEGYRLVLVGRREGPLRETAAMAGAGADGAVVYAADVADAAKVRGAVDAAVQRFGRLDVLVNNAGYAPLLPIERTTPEVIEAAYRVNALAPAHAIARAWPVFLRQGSGCIVNISTMGTDDPFEGFFAYAASKAAVNLMAKSCAKEGRPHGIRAFAVAPAAVETAMLRGLFPPEVIPPEACLSPGEVAAVVVDCVLGRRDEENGRTIFLAGRS